MRKLLFYRYSGQDFLFLLIFIVYGLSSRDTIRIMHNQRSELIGFSTIWGDVKLWSDA